MIDYYETRSQPITRKMVWQAYQKVKSNKGSVGVDQMDWNTLDRNLKTHLYKLWNRLSSGSYFPVPVREVSIKKNKWMDQHHGSNPFERYADDIVVHCKTERQAKYLLKEIKDRFEACRLKVHEGKTKIVNIRSSSEKKYPMSFDFLGFTIEPHYTKVKSGERRILPRCVMSKKSVRNVLDKFRKLHKRRVSIEVLAQELIRLSAA